MPKPRILHLIDSLGVGGAETLLANTIPLLGELDHVVCHLHGPDTLAASFAPHAVHCLDHRGWHDLPRTIARLRALVWSQRIDLVHSHLMLSTWFARLAVPKSVPLLFTLHNVLSEDSFKHSRAALLAERVTTSARQSAIAVSQTVMDDYLQHVPFKGRGFVVHNFIPDRFFDPSRSRSRTATPSRLRCVAIGNLRAAKNHALAVRAFAELRDLPIELDIYGEGELHGELTREIHELGSRVTLKGMHRNIADVLPDYDVFVSTAKYEGYGLTVVEAMAVGLPAFVSELPVLREVTGGHAKFFDSARPGGLAALLEGALAGRIDLVGLADRGREQARLVGSRERYEARLRDIYRELIPLTRR